MSGASIEPGAAYPEGAEPAPPVSEAPPEGRGNRAEVPRSEKLAYAMGGFGPPMLVDAVGELQRFYTIILGLNPVLAGWALGVAALVDAFTDPLMGQISDNTRSRWGRRKPYVLLGGVVAGLLFTTLWMIPEGLEGMSAFVYVTVALVLFHIAATVVIIPYNALGTEMSTDYDERTRVFAWRNAVTTVAAFLLMPMWWVGTRDIFPSQQTGFVAFAVGIALVSIGGFVWVVLGTRERADVQLQAQMPFIPAFLATLSSGPFWALSASFLILFVGILGFVHFSYFVNVYHVFGGDVQEASWVMMVVGFIGVGAELAGVVVATKLATWIGKRNALMACMGVFMLGPISSWFVYNPDYPWLQVLMPLLFGPGVVGVVMLPWAMLADVIDTDELKTNRRREGAFAAIFTFVMKGVAFITLISVGYALSWLGFDEEATVQSPETLLNLRLVFAIGPTAMILLAIPLLLLYPLNEERVRATREVLDQRRATESAESDGGRMR
jgi:GPH family glycoside/pentoside/hexuronide:cation symporter